MRPSGDTLNIKFIVEPAAEEGGEPITFNVSAAFPGPDPIVWRDVKDGSLFPAKQSPAPGSVTWTDAKGKPLFYIASPRNATCAFTVRVVEAP